MGTQYHPVSDGVLPFTASGAVPANRFVGFDGAVCGANAKARGVSLFAVADGKAGSVLTLGTAIVEAGEVLAVGDELVSTAAGKAVKAAALAAAITVASGATPVTSSAANGAIGAAALTGGTLPQKINARALEVAAADGSLIEVQLVP